MPGQASFQEALIQVNGIVNQDYAHYPIVPVGIQLLHLDHARGQQILCELSGHAAIRLALLRAVDAVQPNAVLLPFHQQGERIAISHADNLSRQVMGVDACAGKEKK